MTSKSRFEALAFLLVLSIGLYALNAPLVHASGGEYTWGTGLTISQYFIVGMNDEIPATNYAYVFQKMSQDSYTILAQYWNNLVNLNLGLIKDQIELKIPGSKVQWLHVSWTDVEYSTTGFGSAQIHWATVKGFMVEAIVKNNNAGLTGVEIVTIIMAVAILAAVVGLLLTAAWIVWKITAAIDTLPSWLSPWVMIVVGLIIFGVIMVLLYFAIGGKASYSNKKRSIRLGR